MGIEAVAAKLRRREAASSVPAGERLRCMPVGNATDNVRQLFSSLFYIQVANSLNHFYQILQLPLIDATPRMKKTVDRCWLAADFGSLSTDFREKKRDLEEAASARHLFDEMLITRRSSDFFLSLRGRSLVHAAIHQC